MALLANASVRPMNVSVWKEGGSGCSNLGSAQDEIILMSKGLLTNNKKNIKTKLTI